MNNTITNNYESFLEKRNELLDNLAYQLLWLFTCPETEQIEIPSEFPWDRSFIFPLMETAKTLLERAGFPICYPYYVESDIPCVHTSLCQHPNCPFLTADNTDLLES